jgi:hypothetical protein
MIHIGFVAPLFLFAAVVFYLRAYAAITNKGFLNPYWFLAIFSAVCLPVYSIFNGIYLSAMFSQIGLALGLLLALLAAAETGRWIAKMRNLRKQRGA